MKQPEYKLKVVDPDVPGTRRQRVIASSGLELQRQNIYMKEEAWDALTALSKEWGISGSVIISRLIWDETKRRHARRQMSK